MVKEGLFGMAWEKVFKEADFLAGRVDKNAPSETGHPEEVLKRVEQGFTHLDKNEAFMSCMKVKGEKDESL